MKTSAEPQVSSDSALVLVAIKLKRKNPLNEKKCPKNRSGKVVLPQACFLFPKHTVVSYMTPLSFRHMSEIIIRINVNII